MEMGKVMLSSSLGRISRSECMDTNYVTILLHNVIVYLIIKYY